MKYLNGAILFSIGALTAACATPKTLVLSAPAVSMTNEGFDRNVKFISAGDVSSRFCTGDDPVSSKGDLNVGFMDEVIYRAQQDSSARYIANAQFFVQGSCMLLEGTAMK
jgi:hypothetical protein